VALRQVFSPRTSVSSANLHSICFSTIIFTITRGWHNIPGVAALPIASQTGIKREIKKKQLEVRDSPNQRRIALSEGAAFPY
jgi:hypothetical protein